MNGIYYRQDNATGQRTSLGTRNRKAALGKLRAANQAVAQPRLNLDLARIYLQPMTLTWPDALGAR